MLPQNLVTLVNSDSLASLPYVLPANKKYRYEARFVLGGPDVAVEMTPEEIRTYADGVLCDEDNAFTIFVENHVAVLANAYKTLTNGNGKTVVLVGRWHVSERKSFFEPYVLHIIGTRGSVRSKRYDLEIFGEGFHPSAITFAAKEKIDARYMSSFQFWATDMTLEWSIELTSQFVPMVNGVAWLSNNPSAPPIFSHSEWPVGLSKKPLQETLKVNPRAPRNALKRQVAGPIRSSNL